MLPLHFMSLLILPDYNTGSSKAKCSRPIVALQPAFPDGAGSLGVDIENTVGLCLKATGV